MAEERRWLSTGEAAEYTSLHPETLREKVKKGIIKAGMTDGGHLRFHTDELDRYLEQGARDTDTPEWKED